LLPDREEERGSRNLFLYLKRAQVSNRSKVTFEGNHDPEIHEKGYLLLDAFRATRSRHALPAA
jgi:hypothetical protein